MSFKTWFRCLVTCAVVALCAMPALAQRAGQNPGSWDKLIASLEKDDFTCQEGESVHFDPIEKYCNGDFPNALYANYGAPYASGKMPASPRLQEDQPDVEDPQIEPVFRLDPDEAVVLVGTTPPAEAYFSYQIYLALRQFSGETEHRTAAEQPGRHRQHPHHQHHRPRPVRATSGDHLHARSGNRRPGSSRPAPRRLPRLHHQHDRGAVRDPEARP